MPKALLRSYPFGLLMPGRDYQSGSETKEKFTGIPTKAETSLFLNRDEIFPDFKERDAETGWDYFGARYYSPALGRCLAVDPLEERYPSSPYIYVYNSPIIHFDPNGKDGLKLDVGLIGLAPGWLSFRGGFSFVYDFRSGFKIMGYYGFGAGQFHKGFGGGIDVGLKYFSGQIKEGNFASIVGFAADGIGPEISGEVPMETFNKFKNPFDVYQVSELLNEASLGGGVVFGKGAAIRAGFETQTILADFSNSEASENVNLGNQTGGSPADASNVVPTMPTSTLTAMQYSVLGIDPSKSPNARYKKMQKRKEEKGKNKDQN